ncbi:MAG: transposase [candidate division Zixibacteria bacterium]|nr:transposase [candidate division Zixibacteria bacterium]
MVIRKRLNIKGPALVFITTTTHNWTPFFNNDKIATIVLHQLKETIEYYDASLVSYVLMPTHLHMLLGINQIELLSKFMQSFKILNSKAVKTYLLENKKEYTKNEPFIFWKPRFDDLIIQSDKQFRIKMEYIHNNPVKAGLVAVPSDWKYSSAGDWLDNKSGILPIDKSFEWLL